MLLNAVQTGLVWYYFNTIAIAVIIYKLLQIGLARAKRNQAESVSKEDKFLNKIIIFTGILGIVYFFTLEQIESLRAVWESFAKYMQELING